MKVSVIWRWVGMVLVGFALGCLTTITVIRRNMPPSQSISVGNITIKAKKGSTITDAVDITKQDTQDASKKKRRRRD